MSKRGRRSQPQEQRISGVAQVWPEELQQELPAEDWLLVYAKPRMDKLLAEDLQRLGVPGCLFLERSVKRYDHGVQEHLVPLFGGYLFVHGNAGARDEIFATGRAMQATVVSHPELLVGELGQLIELLDASPEEVVVRPELVPGTPVSITAGCFAGCKGIVHKRKRKTELVVNISLLGHSVSAEIPAELAERLEE